MEIRKTMFYILSPIVSALLVALLVFAYGGSNPAVHGHSAGELEATTPAGAVMAFNLASCPTGWVAADGDGGTPDLRGQFIRGLNNFGTGARIDGNQDPGGARALGNLQQDEFESHNHQVSATYISTGSRSAPGGAQMANADLATTFTGGLETRPRNVALIYCVKS